MCRSYNPALFFMICLEGRYAACLAREPDAFSYTAGVSSRKCQQYSVASLQGDFHNWWIFEIGAIL